STPRPSSPTLFPYTTLFRSGALADRERVLRVCVHQLDTFGVKLLHAARALRRRRLVQRVRMGLVEIDIDRVEVADAPHAHQQVRSEEHTSELQSQSNLVCRL